jgi:hypothetical protein
MYGKILSIFLLAVSAAPVAAQPANPQPAEQQQASPQQLRAFVASFQAGVSNGCLLTPPKDIKVPRSYCYCYAKSFVDRYAVNDLADMSNLAERYPQIASTTISVMMRPEAIACAAKQPLPLLPR